LSQTDEQTDSIMPIADDQLKSLQANYLCSAM